MLIKKTFDTGNIALSAADQELKDITIPMLGDVKGLLWEIVVDVAGTLSNQKKLSAAIKKIKLDDKNNKVLWKNVVGTDLRIKHIQSNRGKNISEQDVNNSSRTDKIYLRTRFDKREGPLTLGLTLAPYSDLATGASGGNCQVKLTVLYDTDDKDEVKESELWEVLTIVGAAGVNGVGHRLPKRDLVNVTMFYMATEGDLTDVTFSRGNNNEIDKLTRVQMIGLEDAEFESGHQTSIFLLPHSPYVVDESTVLEFNLANAEDIRLHLFKSKSA